MVRVRAVPFMFTMTSECLSYGLVFAEVWTVISEKWSEVKGRRKFE